MRKLASVNTARTALPNLGFVYEDQFTATPATVLRRADFLGLAITSAQAAVIFETYTAEAVITRFAQTDAGWRLPHLSTKSPTGQLNRGGEVPGGFRSSMG